MLILIERNSYKREYVRFKYCCARALAERHSSFAQLATAADTHDDHATLFRHERDLIDTMNAVRLALQTGTEKKRIVYTHHFASESLSIVSSVQLYFDSKRYIAFIVLTRIIFMSCSWSEMRTLFSGGDNRVMFLLLWFAHRTVEWMNGQRVEWSPTLETENWTKLNCALCCVSPREAERMGCYLTNWKTNDNNWMWHDGIARCRHPSTPHQRPKNTWKFCIFITEWKFVSILFCAYIICVCFPSLVRRSHTHIHTAGIEKTDFWCKALKTFPNLWTHAFFSAGKWSRTHMAAKPAQRKSEDKVFAKAIYSCSLSNLSVYGTRCAFYIDVIIVVIFFVFSWFWFGSVCAFAPHHCA